MREEPTYYKPITHKETRKAVRKALSRMHADREIKTTAYGRYTHLDHPDNPIP